MAWEHLSVDKPHLVYIILGGFTSLFMLCSSVIKERLYIGEATVATICGIIFGPHAANLIDPGTWGNTDRITLEFSRIVLVVQCFAVGVELPKAYMERHWRSVTFLLIPVMTFGWLVTSLFIWATMHDVLNWLDSLVIAACVTATDPVLASSVVGKGKFARRVPKHLRDLLSAESGCNDGMAFPFIYLGLYLIRYRPDADAVAFHWFCFTILYECVFGAIYGVAVGYIARRAIRYAHEKDLIDRESFLVFYFVLALFCAGSGSILGVDDLLVGFACGVGFSNDGWFTEKTEEAHVSNVIDLLINLAFFVYFGTIVPWEQYNADVIGLSPWRLVVIAILVLILRRIPIMLALKPIIPDIKTWREALFAGHFGPIGVGAIFVAILARAELETETTTPLADLPEPGFEHRNIIELIWPITTFLVITSILIHGSSIAVFTLGKHINTLTITMSYTKGNEKSGDWMERLPRIQSRSRSQMSKGAESGDEESVLPDYPGPTLPSGFLRRQREDDTKPFRPFGRSSSRHRNSSRYGAGGPVDPSAIAPARRAATENDGDSPDKSESDTLAAMSEQTSSEGKDSPRARSSSRGRRVRESEAEVYREGDDAVIEDEHGNVLEVMHSRKGESEAERERSIEREVQTLMSDEDVEHGVSRRQESQGFEAQGGVDVAEAARDAESGWKSIKKFANWRAGRGKQQHDAARDNERRPRQPERLAADNPPQRTHGPARAFRFGRTIIVEDEDGEVIKKYDIPAPDRAQPDRRQSTAAGEGGGSSSNKTRERLQRMGTYLGMGGGTVDDNSTAPDAATTTSADNAAEGSSSQAQRPQGVRRFSKKPQQDPTTAADDDDDEDSRIRFTIDGQKRRMSKADFIRQIQQLDPKSRADIVQDSDLPDSTKKDVRRDAREEQKRRDSRHDDDDRESSRLAQTRGPSDGAKRGGVHRITSKDDNVTAGPQGLAFIDENQEQMPLHSVSADLERFRFARRGGGGGGGGGGASETAAERRRRQLSQADDSDDDGTPRVAPAERRARAAAEATVTSRSARPGPVAAAPSASQQQEPAEEQETAAERRRREGALGISREPDDDDDNESTSDSDSDDAAVRASDKSRAPAAIKASSPPQQQQQQQRAGIRFAEQTQPSASRHAASSSTASASASGPASPTGASGAASGPSSSSSGPRIRFGGARAKE